MFIKKIVSLVALSAIACCLPIQAAEKKPPAKLNDDARAFINHMVRRHHYDRRKLTQTLLKAKYKKNIIKYISSPYEALPWDRYRKHFITKNRIAGGVAYWRKHQKILQYAAKQYHLPPSLIVAIIGAETNYGARTGNFSTLNALSTLAFYYKPRAKFFTSELEQYFLLAKEQQLPIFGVKGSYAGAIGIPQFMPSTYRHYAVGYPRNSHIDLMRSNDSAIVSVANYLSRNGWEDNAPVYTTFQTKQTIKAKWLSNTAWPKKSLKQLKTMGITPDIPAPPSRKVAIVRLTDGSGKGHYWLVFRNFRVIMSYNPRIIYAMVVYQLSQAIQKAYEQQVAPTSATTTSRRKP